MDHLAAEWPVWRLTVLEKIVTLEELERSWSLQDVINCCDVLDAIEDARAQGARP